MTTPIEGGASAHVRWLLCGAFTPAPSGKTMRVSRHDFTETLAAAELALTLTVPDRLGGEERRAYTLRWDALPTWKLTAVAERVPVLDALRRLALDLGSAEPARRPSSEQALARVVELVGDGRLAAALRASFAPAADPRPAPAPAPEKAPSGKSEGGALDRIFSQTQAPGSDRAAVSSAVGGFVDAMRRNGATPAAPAYNLASAPARSARRVIEDAVYATAADLLRAPAVAALEAAWRGVKLVVDETPRDGDVEVMLLDTLEANLPAAIEAALSADRGEWPDAVFILDPFTDLDGIEMIAELLSSIQIPAVVTVSPELFAAAVDAAGGPKPAGAAAVLGPAWARFRPNELARWVCLCGNSVVLHTEGQGEAQRSVLGSPVAAAAAMLTASYRETGLFGKVFGPTGALKAPAVHSVDAGRGETMIPLARFVPTSVQAELGAAGVMALGSPKNSDKVIATAWPTASSSQDAVGLPAQVITGRIVRFALWVRDQIQPGTAEQEIKAVFEQAAGVFLFPGIAEGAFLDASVLPDQNGKPRVVHLDVQVRAALAGSSIKLGFDVPLNA